MKSILVIFVTFVAVLSDARSQDTSGASSVLANFGTVELLTLPQPEHVGTYVYVGISRPIPVSEVTTLVPSLSVELSPELGNWGVVATATADVLVSKTVGLDVQITFAHDQPALQFDQAMFFIGPGVGVSLYLGGVVVSPSVNTFYGLSDGSWSLAPSINVSW